MVELQEMQLRYFELLERQPFVAEDLDYGRLDGFRAMLEQLATIKNSGVSVFDMYRREHVFASYNFDALFGYDNTRIQTEGSAYFDSRIHPDDLLELTALGIQMIEFLLASDPAVRSDYKLVNEYRIRNRDEQYVRIVEQHQALALDQHGNVWLSLSVMDLSPRQSTDLSVQSTLVNFRTGEITELPRHTDSLRTSKVHLTSREREVLGLIQKGHLSKEISDLLNISVHTVNTHRQRILEKLDVGNSMEAVQMAARLGLLG
jgi:DNA-binding CsgD family transcriptional regulator